MLTRAVGAWILIGLQVVAARIWWSVPAALTIFVVGVTVYVTRPCATCVAIGAAKRDGPLSPDPRLSRARCFSREGRQAVDPRRCPNRLAGGDVGVVAAYRAAVPIGGDRAGVHVVALWV
jgi:hypothetical protein